MVVDGIAHGEVQCCAFCQGSVAQEVTVIFGAIEAYFAYIAVQPTLGFLLSAGPLIPVMPGISR